MAIDVIARGMSSSVKGYVKKYLTKGSTYKGLLASSSAIPTNQEIGDWYICQFAEDVANIGTIQIGEVIIWNGSSWDIVELDGSGGLTESVSSNITVGASGSGTTFPLGMTLTEYVKKVHIQDNPPNVTIASVPPSSEIKEKGVDTEYTITATATKVSNDLKAVELTSSPVVAEFNGEQNVSDVEQFQKSITVVINNNSSFGIIAKDKRNLQKSVNLSLSFVYPMYMYIVPETTNATALLQEDIDDIITNGTKLLYKKETKTLSYDSAGTYGKFVFAYPKSYGQCTVYDVKNQMNITSGCGFGEWSVLCADGTNQDYYFVIPNVRNKYEDAQVKFNW